MVLAKAGVNTLVIEFYAVPAFDDTLLLTAIKLNTIIMTHQELLRRVEWKDLKNLSIKEMLIENNLTIP